MGCAVLLTHCCVCVRALEGVQGDVGLGANVLVGRSTFASMVTCCKLFIRVDHSSLITVSLEGFKRVVGVVQWWVLPHTCWRAQEI